MTIRTERTNLTDRTNRHNSTNWEEWGGGSMGKYKILGGVWENMDGGKI